MASTRLTRTPSSAGNRRTWTFSAWIKRSKITADQQVFVGDSPRTWIVFTSDDKLQVFVQQDYQLDVKTNMLFRDTNAWYHIVVAVDTTQASQSNRVKIYVNGSLVDVTNSYAVQNFDTGVNNTGEHYIGRLNYADSSYFNGSMSHIHLVDGTQYQASDFGSTDSTTGEWKINTSPSVTYGTNGFFILKDGNSVTDQSGNSNNWTVASGTLTKTEDCPSNVFATLNPLHPSLNTGRSFANGNTYVALGGTARVPEVSTLGMTSGKFYAECKITGSSGGSPIVGITGITYRASANDWLGSDAYDYSYYGKASSVKANDSNETSFGASFTSGDIIGIAVDLDNLKIYFSKNGTWQNSGDPTSGATGTGSAFTLTAPSSTPDSAYFFACSDDNIYAEQRMAWNFGNGDFSGNTISSAGTNASGIGIFEYDVPTGFTALSTKGLNL